MAERVPAAAAMWCHNAPVRQLIAACVLVVFAFLAATDTVMCPDGCQSAASPGAADHCNDSGTCLFCCGGVAVVAAHITIAPQVAVLADPLLPVSAPPLRSAAVLDHPPRLT